MRPSRTLPFIALASVLIATTAAVAAPPSRSAPPTRQTAPASLGASVGVSAPALTVSKVTGQDPADLGQLAGRVVLVEFWATWCAACQTLGGLLEAMHQEWHDDGLTVLGVSREPEDRIRAHLGRDPVGYTIARDLGPTSARYRVQSFPTVILVGRDGKVRHLMVGASAQGVSDLMVAVERGLVESAP